MRVPEKPDSLEKTAIEALPWPESNAISLAAVAKTAAPFMVRGRVAQRESTTLTS